MKYLLPTVALLSAALMIILASDGHAQGPNLVANPGFENRNGEPRPVGGNPQALRYVFRGDSSLTYSTDYEGSITSVLRWFRGNLGTSDYYHRKAAKPEDRDSTQGVRIPFHWGTIGGLEPPTSPDSAYAGFVNIRKKNRIGKPDGWEDRHEYLATRLEDTLTPGQNYMVKFRYAMAEFDNTDANGRSQYLSKYYLKRLGVAFLDTTLPIMNCYEDSLPGNYTWLNEGAGDPQNALEFNGANYQLVENGELPYAGAGEWQTFEAYFSAQNIAGLKYMVIGNFSQRIPMSDIALTENGNPVDPLDVDTNTFQFHFYFFIDDVEVRAIGADTCTCESVFTCPHTRNDSLQAFNPGKCCFTTTIRPRATSCDFRYVRIKAGGVTVSKPPLIDFSSIVETDSNVYASFCTDQMSDETGTRIIMEFIDEDGETVVCTKADSVFCNCPCWKANMFRSPGSSIKVLEPDLTQIDKDSSGNCCWEFSIKNNNSCTFLDTTFVMQAYIYGGTGTITTFAPWTDSLMADEHAFRKPGGLKYNSSSKVFRICTPPQVGNGEPPRLFIRIFHAPTDTGGVACASFPIHFLECRADTNCCDLLDIKLQRKSQTSYSDCDFDLIVRHKNATAKCKVFGIRVKDTNGLVLHTTDSTGTPLNLDRSTVIWSSTLGDPCPTSLQAGYGKKAYYTIEILDSLGAVKCSVADSFRCCYTSGVAMGKDVIEEQELPVELPTGGTITNAYIEGKRLHYAINNKSAAAHTALRIVGMKGEVMMNFEGELKSGMNTGELDISRLASGAYYLVVQTPNWQTSRQIMITR